MSPKKGRLHVQGQSWPTTATVQPQGTHQFNITPCGTIARYRITFSLNEMERLFYNSPFQADLTLCTMTYMISTRYRMIVGHGQVSTYLNKVQFKFVFVDYPSILFNFSPNSRNNKCIKMFWALGARVNDLTSGGQTASQEQQIRYHMKYSMSYLSISLIYDDTFCDT